MELSSIYPTSFSFLSAVKRTRHDVFLSFRGEDTRSIVKELHMTLEKAGIPTFKDDVYLEKGAEIATELMKAIQMSRIAIIVFSRNYADSHWCLKELVKIIECKNEAGQVVFPVFYDVGPGDVKQPVSCDVDPGDSEHKKNTYGEALQELEERFGKETVDIWRSALTEAASSADPVHMHENRDQFMNEILKHIISRHQDAYMSISIFPQRKEAAKDYLNLLLSAVSDDILIIGIWGVDKTNTAKAVYNQNLARFKYSSFVSDVDNVAEHADGLILLQKQFLTDILMDDKNINTSDVAAGIDMIKNALHNKRILAVFDNVNNLDQLNALAGNRNWFSAGSRVIITTKDPKLLNVLEVDDVYGTESIQVIEDQFKQNIQEIKGLMDYIHEFQAKFHETEMSVLAEIEKEKQKNATQEERIAELQGKMNQNNS